MNKTKQPDPQDVVGVLLSPGLQSTADSRALRIWRRHVMANAAPRDNAYMKSLFLSLFPGGRVVEVYEHKAAEQQSAVGSRTVLLYPDAIGLGFGELEEALCRADRSGHIYALNGRGRLLKLDPRTRRRMRIRRLLEWTRLPELLFLGVFMVVTPVILLADLARARR